MNDEQIDDLLRRTMTDFRISRGERKVLNALIREMGGDEQRVAYLRHRAFEMARSDLISPHSHEVVNWLEDIMRALQAPPQAKIPDIDVRFSPGEDCMRTIVGKLNQTRRQADICVFTITDNRITKAIEAAHDRGVAVRVISDNDKSEDRGSDIERMERHGISVRVDQTHHHMHHKYAVFDGRCAITGSYNWTRSAAEHNEENLIVTTDHRALRAFSAKFAELWKELTP